MEPLINVMSDGLLNASFSVFRIEQENVTEADPLVQSSTITPYSANDEVIHEGFDAELSGDISDNPDMTVGLTHFTATSEQGLFNTN